MCVNSFFIKVPMRILKRPCCGIASEVSARLKDLMRPSTWRCPTLKSIQNVGRSSGSDIDTES